MSRAGTKYEILQGGMEISSASAADSGTLGCVVFSSTDSSPMLLTNRHVAYDDAVGAKKQIELILNRAKYSPEQAKRYPPDVFEELKGGALPIFQPAYKGGETKESRVVAYVSTTSGASDAAVCRLAKGIKYNSLIMANPDFLIKGMTKAEIGMLVIKSGKVTDVTWGVVTGIQGDTIIIEHPFSKALPIPEAEPAPKEKVITDPNLILIKGLVQTAISKPGDSGSVWVDTETQKAVGLLYKGLWVYKNKQAGRPGDNYSVANDITGIAAKLKFTF